MILPVFLSLSCVLKSLRRILNLGSQYKIIPKPRELLGDGRFQGKLANHDPKASDLQGFRVFSQHSKLYHVIEPGIKCPIAY